MRLPCGIGKVTAEKFHAIGIRTGADLKQLSLNEIKSICGKTGHYLYDAVRGIDDRSVRSHWERKSVGTERTFIEDIYTSKQVDDHLSKIAIEAWNRQLKSKKQGKTITVKVKYSDFSNTTKRKTFMHPVTQDQLLETIKELTPYKEIENKGCRLLGLSFSGFDTPIKKEANIQLTIDFETTETSDSNYSLND